MVNKEFCDKCGKEIEKLEKSPVCDYSCYVRCGEREIDILDLCNPCLSEFEEVIKEFLKTEFKEGRTNK